MNLYLGEELSAIKLYVIITQVRVPPDKFCGIMQTTSHIHLFIFSKYTPARSMPTPPRSFPAMHTARNGFLPNLSLQAPIQKERRMGTTCSVMEMIWLKLTTYNTIWYFHYIAAYQLTSFSMSVQIDSFVCSSILEQNSTDWLN